MLIAKKNKNFVESDKIRAELKSIGYAVSNTASSIAIIYVGGDSV
jgi:cysteinyl-tRNA synthetase